MQASQIGLACMIGAHLGDVDAQGASPGDMDDLSDLMTTMLTTMKGGDA